MRTDAPFRSATERCSGMRTSPSRIGAKRLTEAVSDQKDGYSNHFLHAGDVVSGDRARGRYAYLGVGSDEDLARSEDHNESEATSLDDAGRGSEGRHGWRTAE